MEPKRGEPIRDLGAESWAELEARTGESRADRRGGASAVIGAAAASN